MEPIFFDDWALRHEKAFHSRKIEFVIVLSIISVITLAYLAVLMFYWYVVFFFVPAVFAWTVIVFEWLKIKNNHLIIRENAITITDRFGRERIYPVDYRTCILVVQRSINARSGGIWLKFYDSNHALVCKYEDMLNVAAAYGQPLTQWERAVFALGIPVEDRSNLFKNN